MNEILHNFRTMPLNFSNKKKRAYDAEYYRIKIALREMDAYGGGLDEEKNTPLEYEV